MTKLLFSTLFWPVLIFADFSRVDNFDAGISSDWNAARVFSQDRLKIVDKALQVTLKKDDRPVFGGHRAEIADKQFVQPAETISLDYKINFPENFELTRHDGSDERCVISQLHDQNRGTTDAQFNGPHSPPFALRVRPAKPGPGLALRVTITRWEWNNNLKRMEANEIILADNYPISKDDWHKIHIDARLGYDTNPKPYLNVTVNGKPLFPRYEGNIGYPLSKETHNNELGTYFKMGLYCQNVNHDLQMKFDDFAMNIKDAPTAPGLQIDTAEPPR